MLVISVNNNVLRMCQEYL